MRALACLPGVVVTGEVPEVGFYLERASVFVAPLRIAQGVQNKVLQAMSAGLPVICTHPVFAGIADGGFLPGRDLLVADTPDELVEAIAENDETLMDLYFEHGELDEYQMREGLQKAILNRQIFPLFCTSALRNMGTGRIMSFMGNVLPSPADARPLPGLGPEDHPGRKLVPAMMKVILNLIRGKRA